MAIQVDDPLTDVSIFNTQPSIFANREIIIVHECAKPLAVLSSKYTTTVPHHCDFESSTDQVISAGGSPGLFPNTVPVAAMDGVNLALPGRIYSVDS